MIKYTDKLSRSLVPLRKMEKSSKDAILLQQHMIRYSRIFGRLDIFTCTCRDFHVFRGTKRKVRLGFTIISSIAATTLKLKDHISLGILSLKVNLELNHFLILKTTFKSFYNCQKKLIVISIFPKGSLS